MPPGDIAPVVVVIILAIVTGGVLVLRPLTKRLGDLLEVSIEERRRRVTGQAKPDDTRVIDVLESIDERLSSLEEKQRFTDAILHTEAKPAIPPRTRPPE